MTVPPWIPPTPLLAFVGQSPGSVEHRRGRPFVGPAGRTLRRWIRALGLAPDELMYTNVGSDYKPHDPNYVPRGAEFKEGCQRVLEELASVADTLNAVVLLGECASHLAFKGRMGQMHGLESGLLLGESTDPLKFFACYHPSYYNRLFDDRPQYAATVEGQIVSVLQRAVTEALGREPISLPEPVYVDSVEVLP